MFQLLNVSKSYDGRQPVLSGINLAVAAGEVVCLLGPSGCGKTTLLRVIAGLEKMDTGVVLCQGDDLAYVPVHRRNFGLMFQEFALFPHKSVGENIAFGLRMARQPSAQITTRVAEMLTLVNLREYAERSVFELSGGERQRVALARSLAPNPRLLMLDEPLGSLDQFLREELMNELRAILKRIGMTALYVTHDQEEAFAVADRIVVMNQGRIEQIDTPQALYARPANEFVARFLGFHNLIPAQVHPESPEVASTSIGAFSLAAILAKPLQPGPHTLLIRPEAARLDSTYSQPGWLLRGVLAACSFRGSHCRIVVTIHSPTDSQQLRFHLPAYQGQQLPAVGETIELALEPAMMTLL